MDEIRYLQMHRINNYTITITLDCITIPTAMKAYIPFEYYALLKDLFLDLCIFQRHNVFVINILLVLLNNLI